jgi:hypothetical protein
VARRGAAWSVIERFVDIPAMVPWAASGVRPRTGVPFQVAGMRDLA